jgi:hypothetical protein
MLGVFNMLELAPLLILSANYKVTGASPASTALQAGNLHNRMVVKTSSLFP